MSNRALISGRIMAHWSSRRQSTTTSSALPVHVQHRPEELGADVHRERRPVAVAVVQPAGVVALEVAGEVLPQALLQRAERVLQPRLVGLPQPHLPLGQLGHQLDPLAPGQRAAAAGLELAEPGREVAGEALLADPVAVEQPGDHREDLARVDRLDQVVGDLGADGVLEGLGLLALGHHHHRHAVVDGPDGAEQLQPPPAGHLLVEQDHAVGLALEQDQRVVAVGGGLHGEALLLEKEDVGREALDLVVHPENALGTGHGGKIAGGGRRRRTEAARRSCGAERRSSTAAVSSVATPG